MHLVRHIPKETPPRHRATEVAFSILLLGSFSFIFLKRNTTMIDAVITLYGSLSRLGRLVCHLLRNWCGCRIVTQAAEVAWSKSHQILPIGTMKNKKFVTGPAFENRLIVRRKYFPQHLCHFVPFFEQPKTEKKYYFSGKWCPFIGNQPIIAFCAPLVCGINMVRLTSNCSINLRFSCSLHT